MVCQISFFRLDVLCGICHDNEQRTNNPGCLIPVVLAGPNWSTCSPGRSVKCASLGGILKAVHVEHHLPALIEWRYHSHWMCKFLSSGLWVSEFSSTSKPFLSCCLCKNIEVLRGWKWRRYGTHRSLAQSVIVLEWRNRAEKTTWRAELENCLNLVILMCISKLWILQELNSRRCNGGGSAAPWTFNPAMLVKHLENLRIQVRRWSTSSTLITTIPKQAYPSHGAHTVGLSQLVAVSICIIFVCQDSCKAIERKQAWMQGWEYMPSFDHGVGDPVEKDIYVAPQYVYHLPPFAVEEKTFNPVHLFLTGL